MFILFLILSLSIIKYVKDIFKFYADEKIRKREEERKERDKEKEKEIKKTVLVNS